MKSITIRQALPSDNAAIGALFIQLDTHHITKRPGEFLRLDGPARSPTMIAEMIEADDQVVLVAEDTDYSRRLLGLANMRRRDYPPSIVAPARTVAEVDSLVVADDARRCGLGSRLLAAAAHWASKNGFSILELGVREFNDEALAFYKAAGMKTASRRMSMET